MTTHYTLTPIGFAKNGHKEKFGTPRQSLLTKTIFTAIELSSPYNDPSALMGLEGYSHLWIQFLFHEHHPYSWSPTVRPPRLGGNKKMGVFATRSPFRPNLIGLSLVKLHEIKKDQIIVSGADFIDGTPILDIKPYLKSTEALSDAREGWTDQIPLFSSKKIIFSKEALIVTKNEPGLEEKISEVLRLGNSVAYKEEGHEFGFSLEKFNIRYMEQEEELFVLTISKD